MNNDNNDFRGSTCLSQRFFGFWTEKGTLLNHVLQTKDYRLFNTPGTALSDHVNSAKYRRTWAYNPHW